MDYNTRRLARLTVYDGTLALLGRYGGVAGAWSATILRGPLQAQIEETRAAQILQLCHALLSRLPPTLHCEVLAALHMMFRVEDEERTVKS